MKNKKNIRKLMFDRSVRPAVKAVQCQKAVIQCTMKKDQLYHAHQSTSPRQPPTCTKWIIIVSLLSLSNSFIY